MTLAVDPVVDSRCLRAANPAYQQSILDIFVLWKGQRGSDIVLQGHGWVFHQGRVIILPTPALYRQVQGPVSVPVYMIKTGAGTGICTMLYHCTGTCTPGRQLVRLCGHSTPKLLHLYQEGLHWIHCCAYVPTVDV